MLFRSPTTHHPVPFLAHPRILVTIIVILCTQHDCCHLSGSPLSSNISPPNSRVVVVCSTHSPPCKQLLAAVGVGAGLSVINIGVVVVVLVVPVVVLFPIVWSCMGLPAPLSLPLSMIKSLTSHLDGEEGVCMVMVGCGSYHVGIHCYQ